MSDSEFSRKKPPIQPRPAMTRKVDDEETEAEEKPTLANRPARKIAGRLERILATLNSLDEARLQKLCTQIGGDELAVALLDADKAIKQRLASCMKPEQLELFKQYLSMGKDKLPSSVIDEVQGKLLRIASFC